MIRFMDGPAAGVVLQLLRAPVHLRVVLAENGTWDALDQVADTPEAGEKVYAYHRTRKPTQVHIDYTDRATRRRRGAWYQAAEYFAVRHPPREDVLRDTGLWQAWARARHRGLPDPAALVTAGQLAQAGEYLARARSGDSAAWLALCDWLQEDVDERLSAELAPHVALYHECQAVQAALPYAGRANEQERLLAGQQAMQAGEALAACLLSIVARLRETP